MMVRIHSIWALRIRSITNIRVAVLFAHTVVSTCTGHNATAGGMSHCSGSGADLGCGHDTSASSQANIRSVASDVLARRHHSSANQGGDDDAEQDAQELVTVPRGSVRAC